MHDLILSANIPIPHPSWANQGTLMKHSVCTELTADCIQLVQYSEEKSDIVLQSQTTLLYLPCTWKIVKCGRHWKEPNALPAQFIHSPW